jgi:4-amino-4-deoxy-L-arabinose transferase-like glycosyltransferase
MDGTWIDGWDDLHFESDTFMLGALVAMILPPIFSIIVQTRWKPEVKGLVALVLCVLVSLGVAALTGKITTQSDLANALVPVITLTFVMYRQFWKPSTITTEIEERTNV